MEIEPLSTSPAAFAPLAAKINELVEAIRPLLNIEGQNGIKVNYYDNNISIEIPQDLDGYGGGTWVPSGSTGDMLYHDGTGWITLPAPTVSVADPVLRHNGTNPYWEEPESC